MLRQRLRNTKMSILQQPLGSSKTVTNQPLKPDHAADLYHIVEGEANKHSFTYLFDKLYSSLESFQEAVSAKSKSEDPMFFAIVNEEGFWLGRFDAHRHYTSCCRSRNILFSPLLQRTRAATEAERNRDTCWFAMRYAEGDVGRHEKGAQWGDEVAEGSSCPEGIAPEMAVINSLCVLSVQMDEEFLDHIDSGIPSPFDVQILKLVSQFARIEW